MSPLPLHNRRVYPVGARVRLTVDAPSAWPDSKDPLEAFGVEAGHGGEITSVTVITQYHCAYGVRLDGDPHPAHISASFTENEIELAGDPVSSASLDDMSERLAVIARLASALQDYLPGDGWDLAHSIEQCARGDLTPAQALENTE